MGRRATKGLAWLLALSGLLGSTLAQAWWDEGWAFRKEIVLDTSPTGVVTNTALLEVPVLVRLHVANFPYFADVKADGSDLRFVAADDVTPLSFHIEKFDPVAQVGLIWVRVPQLAPGLATQPLYMYYGNPEAVAGSTPAQTYGKETVAALHFEPPSVLADATAYNNQPLPAAVPADVNGFIGSSLLFGGQGELQFPASPSLRFLPEKGWTAQYWLRLEESQTLATLLELRDPASGALRVTVEGTTPQLVLENAAGEPAEATASTSLTLGTWHLLGIRLDESGAQLLIDARVVARLDQALPQLGGALRIGNDASGQTALRAVRVDELQFANVARPDDWFRLQAGSQAMGASFLRYGEDSQRDEAETESHLVTTLRNVQWAGLEGWVIVICVFMALFSLYVIFTKGVSISRTRRANVQFLGDFERSDSIDDMGPDAPQRYQGSTLAEIYGRAMTEVDSRLGGHASVGAAATRSLTPESLSAIRASLQALNVRTSQRLNSMMVLLTLAIAGGPFLGLLGTVVGVMVTFAGIAASGDVNINAIAPGIAAALVATVAGLGVAIPALFGYNYISTRIKEVITENNVFLEELMASATETYQA